MESTTTTISKKGFYKQDENGIWLYAPNYVESPTYTLLAEKRNEYKLPIDGWNWYEEQPYEDKPILDIDYGTNN